MGFKRLVNASISADQFKKWFFSGYTNANGGRELEIFNSVAELVWRRRDRKYNVGSPTAPNPEHINDYHPYYWETSVYLKGGAQAGGTSKVWQVWLNNAEGHPNDTESWTLRELELSSASNDKNYTTMWSLGIYPGLMLHQSINWEYILYDGIYSRAKPISINR